MPSTEFEEAVKNSKNIKDASNANKLKLYALFKQVTVGLNNSPKPGMFDLVGTAKWDAWKSLGMMSKDVAETEYVKLVNDLLFGGSGTNEESTTSVEGLLVTTQNKIRTITWNRPEKMNAITKQMFLTLTKVLQDSNNDDGVNIVVITGAGDYFCSGNDLSNFTNFDSKEIAKVAQIWIKILGDFFAAFIDFKKPLIGIVNGPAIGVGVTILAFCDAVFASEKATFSTPFTTLGQSPEACSTYLFPRIMGYAKANEMLLFGKTFTARKAELLGLVTEVFHENELKDEAWNRIEEMDKLPLNSLIHTKELIRGRERSILHQVNNEELSRLKERWLSDDCMNAVTKFFARKDKPVKNI